MNPREIIDRLKAKPFEPFFIVGVSGDRYEVRHPENAIVAEGGVLYLYRPSVRDDAQVERGPTVISIYNIMSLEPMPESQKAA